MFAVLSPNWLGMPYAMAAAVKPELSAESAKNVRNPSFASGRFRA